MFYFGLKTHSDVAAEIDRLSANVSGTIIYSTFFAHQCEVRQCINRFGLAGTAFLVHLYYTVQACREAADDAMRAMRDGSWRKSGCFACMVLDEVRLAKQLTVQDVKDLAKKRCSRGSQPTASPRDVVRSMSALSPKLCLEGIPEWLALQANLDLLISKCLSSYHGLYNVAKSLDITVNTPAGGRRSKAALQQSIGSRLRGCKDVPSLPTKRSWAELEAQVIAAGGETRSYVARKRRRMKKHELIGWLKMHKPSQKALSQLGETATVD